MNVLKDFNLFFIWAAWALFNFPKQQFSVWIFTENTSFISFHGGILSRYSEINKFKTSKDLSIQNNKNTLKNAGFTGNFKYNEAVSFTGYSL